MASKPKEYRALSGMNYPHPDKEDTEVRVEAGDKLTIVPDDKWVQKMVNQGHLEEFEPNNTENVTDHAAEVVEVYGVMSRHRDGEIVLRPVGSEE
jgi:hypothetical protein